jgi:FkbM family methyltransferase
MEFKTTITEFRDYKFKIAFSEELDSSSYTFFDEKDVRLSKWKIESGDCALDIGANYGSYTLTALAAGAGHVLAFNPKCDQETGIDTEILIKSLKLNDWSEKCEIHQVGLYSKTGWLNWKTQEFYSAKPKNDLSLKTNQITSWDKDDSIIQVTNLDSILDDAKIENLKKKFTKFWMKIDTEGAELEILKGAQKTLAGLRPKILVENHNFKGNLEEQVRKFLIQLGYKEIETTPHFTVSHSLYYPI